MRRTGTALFLLIAAACCWLPAAVANDKLVIGITQFPSTFHPSIDAMMAKTYVLAMTRRPLTAYDANWRLVCMLCTRLPTLDNGLAVPETTPDGKDGMAVTYTILPAAVWADGTPITTRDVLHTWEVGRHPQSGVTPKELYRSLYAIDADDSRTFTLHFDRRTYRYNDISGIELLPAHLDGPALANPERYRFATPYETDTTNPGLYSGPYVIREVVSGSHITLAPNPRWWGDKPAFGRIVVRVIENTTALEANLLSGAIDMVAGELGLALDQAIAFERRHGSRFTVVYKPGLVYEHIDLNLDNPILRDPRVRQALILSIDRAAISNALFDGRQPVADTSVSPLDGIFAEDVPRYRFDPDKAAALLAAAGWKTLRDGTLHDDAATPLRLEFMTTAGNRSRELVQQALQSQWKRMGIDVRIRNQPARVFFGQTVTERRFSAMALFAWISAPESVPRTTLHSGEVPSPDNGFAGQNYAGFRNPEVDGLLEAIEVELDGERRRALWRRLQHIYAEQLPAIPLFFVANAYILPNWLKGVVPTGHQYPTTLWIEQWFRQD
jgi:peptide/nickel transport system substrate-binding protein